MKKIIFTLFIVSTCVFGEKFNILLGVGGSMIKNSYMYSFTNGTQDIQNSKTTNSIVGQIQMGFEVRPVKYLGFRALGFYALGISSFYGTEAGASLWLGNFGAFFGLGWGESKINIKAYDQSGLAFNGVRGSGIYYSFGFLVDLWKSGQLELSMKIPSFDMNAQNVSPNITNISYKKTSLMAVAYNHKF